MEAHTQAEYQGFLKAICEQPAEDAHRLVLADWLEERGHGDRAAFIRVQCELAKPVPKVMAVRLGIPQTDTSSPYTSTPDPKAVAAREKRRRREKELLTRWWKDWTPTNEFWFCSNLREEEEHAGRSYVEFRRGFIDSLRLPATNWLKHADSIVWHPKQNCPVPATAQPITHVTLTQIRGVDVDALCARNREAAAAGGPIFGVLETEWPWITFDLQFDLQSASPDGPILRLTRGAIERLADALRETATAIADEFHHMLGQRDSTPDEPVGE